MLEKLIGWTWFSCCPLWDFWKTLPLEIYAWKRYPESFVSFRRWEKSVWSLIYFLMFPDFYIVCGAFKFSAWRCCFVIHYKKHLFPHPSFSRLMYFLNFGDKDWDVWSCHQNTKSLRNWLFYSWKSTLRHLLRHQTKSEAVENGQDGAFHLAQKTRGIEFIFSWYFFGLSERTSEYL